MKIIAFTQLRNELSNGNLENWFKQMEVCDYIYIFDQNSDDGSKEYYKKFDNCTVIESPTNRFKEELICKNELLKILLADHPDVDWILWIDGDLMLDGRLLKDNGKDRPSPLGRHEHVRPLHQSQVQEQSTQDQSHRAHPWQPERTHP